MPDDLINNQSPQTEQPSPTASRRRRAAGYIGVFLLCYAAFLIVTFPYDLLAQGILRRAKSSLPVPLKASKIEPHFPLKFILEEVEIGPFSKKDDRKIVMDYLNVEASLVKALKKRIDAKAEAQLYDGKIKADYFGSDISGDATLRIVSIDLKSFIGLVAKIPWVVSGEVGGKGKFHWDRLKPMENTGEFRLNSSNLQINEVSLKVVKTNFRFSKSQAHLLLEQGNLLKVKSLVLEGEPCGFDMSGTVKFNLRDPAQSRLDLTVKLHPSPEFEKKIPFNILKKDDNGIYIGKLRGTFKKPSFP